MYLLNFVSAQQKKKKNQHIEKASYEMGENIWTSSLWWGVNVKQTFHQRKHTNAQQL